MPLIEVDTPNGPVRVEVRNGFYALNPEAQAEEIRAKLATPPPEGRTELGLIGTQALSGFNEGAIANTLGAAPDAVAWLINNAASLFGADEKLIDQPVFGSDHLRELLRTDIAGLGPMSEPPYQGYEFPREAGEFTGEGIGMLTGLMGAPKLAGKMAGAGAAQAPASAAGRAFRDMAAHAERAPLSAIAGEALSGTGAAGAGQFYDSLGLDPDYRWLAELVGGVGAPVSTAAVSAGVVDPTIQRTFGTPMPGRPDPGAIYDAATRAGVRPTGGLVGNPSVQRLESAAGYMPVIGSKVARVQNEQNQQLGERIDRVAEDVAGSPRPPEVDEQQVGQRIQSTAGEAATNLRGLIDNSEQMIQNRVTPDGIDVSGIRQRLNAMARDTDAKTRDEINSELDYLERIREAPIDPALDTQLRQTLSTLQQMQGLPGLDPQTAAMVEQALRRALDEIDANMGVRYTNLKNWRSRVGEATNSMSGMTAKGKHGVYEAGTEALRGAAQDAGDDVLKAFDFLMQKERQILSDDQALTQGGDMPFLKDLSKTDTGQAFSKLVPGSNMNPERMATFKENVMLLPDGQQRWNEIVGDVIALLGKDTAGRQDATGEAFNAQVFLTNWSKSSKETKRILIGDDPDLEQALDDIAVLASAMKERAKVGRPNAAASALAHLGGIYGVLQHPVETAAAAATGIATLNTLLSEAFARSVAGRSRTFAEKVQPSIARAVRYMGHGAEDNLDDYPDYGGEPGNAAP